MKIIPHLFGGLNVGVLVADGFEQLEMTAPRKALEELGASFKILSTWPGQVQGFHENKAGESFDVDLIFDKARSEDFDALLLPGGAVNANAICHDPDAQRLVRNADRDGKPIGVLGHGAQLLVCAKLAKGRELAAGANIAGEVKGAGGRWVDQEVVVDGNWVSSRNSGSLAAFTSQFKQVIAQHVKHSIVGTADDIPAAAGTGG